jgi:raffinose/stachyose/melibiose transport system permease protein
VQRLGEEAPVLQPTAVAVPRPRRRPARRWVVPWLFALPALLIHVLVVAGPSLATFGMSLFDWNGLTVGPFVGLQNFVYIFTRDETFPVALANNLKWTLIALSLPVWLALAVAVMVRSVRHGGIQVAYRTIFFIPSTIAGVVVARIWQWIYHPFYGINALLSTSPVLSNLAFGWLTDPNVAIYSVALADNWRTWGFLMVVFLAALHQIDPALYEAAQVEGANRWQIFRYVTVPSLRPTIVFVMVNGIIGSFLVIELIYLMTQGGPGNASQVLSMWIYQQAVFEYRPDYASAIAVVTTLMLSVVIAGFVIVRKRGWEV